MSKKQVDIIEKEDVPGSINEDLKVSFGK